MASTARSRRPNGFKAGLPASTWRAAGARCLSIRDWGGQGLPKLVATAVEEMFTASNMSFSLCPLLTQGAIHALELCGSDALKNTTCRRWSRHVDRHDEPHRAAGRLDLALVRTKAERAGDHYRIRARRSSSPTASTTWRRTSSTSCSRARPTRRRVKGISLFLVPKFLVKADGSLGERNNARCASIEHKLGIHASPTAVMVFEEGAWAIWSARRTRASRTCSS